MLVNAGIVVGQALPLYYIEIIIPFKSSRFREESPKLEGCKQPEPTGFVFMDGENSAPLVLCSQFGDLKKIPLIQFAIA